MGFGILLIGYFFVFNIPYFGMTDIISAAVMAMGLNKLSKVNTYFRKGYYTAVIFTAFSIPEFIFYALDLFGIYTNGTLISYLRVAGSVIVCSLTLLILKGIYDVAKEVDLERVPKKSERLIYATFIIYSLWILCNAPILTDLLGGYVAYVYLAAITSLLVLVALNFGLIYTCYIRICMPSDNKDKSAANHKLSAREAAREERRLTDEEYRRKRSNEKHNKKETKK